MRSFTIVCRKCNKSVPLITSVWIRIQIPINPGQLQFTYWVRILYLPKAGSGIQSRSKPDQDLYNNKIINNIIHNIARKIVYIHVRGLKAEALI